VIVQVKSGHVKSGDISELLGTVERERAAMGVFITLEAPTKDMRSHAVHAGFYHLPGWNRDFPKIQILTIEELLNGAAVKMPPSTMTFKQAQREKRSSAKQEEMDLDE
jgi:hypothetical protein